MRELDLFDALERSVRQLDEEITTLSEQTGMASLLESIPGVADVTASVFLGYIGQVQRFRNVSAFKAYCGVIPRVVQSGVQRQASSPLTKAGPDHIKQVLFMAANAARQCDPQLAKIYSEHMVLKGQHHAQAICTVATYLAARIFMTCRMLRPYELRGVDGSPIDKKRAREIIQERYTVPQEVRRRKRAGISDSVTHNGTRRATSLRQAQRSS